MGSLNRKWVVWNLREAVEEIERTVSELETESDYTDASLRVRLREVYNHLNTAWNSREVSEEVVQAASAEDSDRWWVMPDDIIY